VRCQSTWFRSNADTKFRCDPAMQQESFEYQGLRQTVWETRKELGGGVDGTYRALDVISLSQAAGDSSTRRREGRQSIRRDPHSTVAKTHGGETEQHGGPSRERKLCQGYPANDGKPTTD
jgi:hypothetical protein